MTADPFATPGQQVPYAGRPRGDAEDRAPVDRDQWDRYLIPALDGTKPATNKGYTRVSTLKDSAVDKRGINIHNQGLVAAGIATVPALAKIAAEAVRDDDKKLLRKTAARAIEAAGGKDRTALGTNVHDATERINRGETDVHVPAEYKADVDAYYELLATYGVKIKREYMERVVLCEYHTAGTFDNIVEYWNLDAGEIDEETGKPIGEWEWLVADLKTGRELKDGYLEIIIQLWLYANAKGILNLETNQYEPMPTEVRRDKAMIIHVPMAGGVAELWTVDISGAERYVKAAVELRCGNREASQKWRSVGKVQPAPFVMPMDVPGHSTGAELAAKEASYQVPAGAVADPSRPSGWRPEEPAPPQVVDVATGQQVPVSHGPQRTAQQIADGETAAQRLTQAEPFRTPTEPAASVGMNQGDTVTVAGVSFTKIGDNPFPANPGQQIAETILNGEGKPLAPLAEPGKRGCSVCGRTGHRRGSKACLGDRDPASINVEPTPDDGPAEPAPLVPSDADQRAYDYAARTISPEFAQALAPNHPVGEQGPEPFIVPAAPGPHLFDPIPNDKLGRCRLCGQGPDKPIHAPAWAADTADGDDAPAPGTPGGGPALPEPVYPAPAAPWCTDSRHRSQGWTASGDQWVCPVDGLPSEESWKRAQADPIAQAIEQCTTPAQVLAVRQATIDAGRWSPTYNAQAQAKHQALSWPA